MHSRRLRAPAVAILALFAASCGNDNGPQLEAVATTASAATAPATTAAPTTATPSTLPVPTGPTTTLGAAPPELSRPQLNDQSAVSTAGIGPLTFGKPVAEAQTIIGTRLLTETGQAPAGTCYTVKPELGPAGVFFVVSSGTVERVDIRSGKVKTRSGYGIGTTVDQLKTAFGAQLQATGNTYTLVPTSAGDASFRVVFETDGSAVTSFRAGRVPLVTALVACT